VTASGTEHVTEFAPVNTFRAEMEDFCAAVLDGTPPRLTPQDALANARILDRIAAAARR
jgi:predicted dehydrogenase